MLQSISIENFKKIKEKIVLDDLSRVNYLVGTNSSGKSSILEGVLVRKNNVTFKSYPNAVVDITFNSSDWSWTPVNLVHKNYTFTGGYGLVTQTQKNETASAYYSKTPGIHIDRALNGTFEYSVENLIDYRYTFDGVEISKESVIPKFLKGGLKHILNLINLPEKIADIETSFADHVAGEKALNYKVTLDDNTKVNTDFLAGGYNYLIKLIFLINIFIEKHKHYLENDCLIVMIEEPEAQLHPDLQKQLPIIFNEFCKLYPRCDFIISTHSPFVISAASKEKKDASIDKPYHKIYLIENGKCKHPKGFSGEGVIGVATKMLGAGLDDMVKPNSADLTPNCPLIVICEGQNSEKDAKIYNQIFQNHKRPCLFISSKSAGKSENSPVRNSSYLLAWIQNIFSADFELRILTDRDSNYNDKELEEKLKKDKFERVTRRRALECYIFNRETAELWCNKNSILLDQSKLELLIDFEKQVWQSCEEQSENFDYKRIGMHWQNITGIKGKVGDDTKVEIAKLITFETDTYKDLENCIFG